MAQLEFTAGPITSTITASNAKASTVFKNSAQLLGYTGDINDNQAVANFVMIELRRTLTGWSKQYQERTDVEAAKDSVKDNLDLEFDI